MQKKKIMQDEMNDLLDAMAESMACRSENK
jgi:hypothetical protein